MSASPTLLQEKGLSCDRVRPVVPKEIGRLTEDGLTTWPGRGAILPEEPASTWQQPCEHPAGFRGLRWRSRCSGPTALPAVSSIGRRGVIRFTLHLTVTFHAK